MESMTAKFLGGPQDGLILEVSKSAFYMYFPVLMPVEPRWMWDFEVYPDEVVPTKTLIYVLHSHDRFNPRLAYFVYRGIQ